MPTKKPLDEALEEIVDAIVAAVEAAIGPGHGLDGVKSVVRGEQTRPLPKLPAIWVVSEPAKNDQTTFGLAEAWTLPVSIAALVKSDDPDAGSREAVRLAARARSAVLENRKLGLSYVRDVVSDQFQSARTSERNRNLFWADARVLVRFETWEVE